MHSYGNYPDLTNIRRILVMKLRHLGDVLLTSPVFTVLKKRLPQARIDAYIYREAMPMLEGHPAVGEILGYDRSWKQQGFMIRLAREAGMLRKIRKNNYDLVINLTEGDRGALVARASGAALRVGIDPRRIYTHVVKNCPTLRHTVERHLDALRKIGIFPDAEERELFFAIPEKAQETALQKVSEEHFILIHPTSRWRFKCWPREQVRALAERLIEKDERLIFTSGPDITEQEMIQEIVQGLPAASVCNLAGLLSLKELGALIARCKVLLCVDSVPLHIASALKAPVVALFGPTSEITWGPWRNPRARIVTAKMSCRPCYLDGCGGSKRSDCLSSLTVEQVLLQLEAIITRRNTALSVF